MRDKANNMAEKYTIEKVDDSVEIVYYDNKDKVCFHLDEINNIAKICRLLNENDSRPRIDKNLARETIADLERKLRLWKSEEMNHVLLLVRKDSIESIENLIEIISNLPCEEN